ncbi:internal virion protein [Cyanophage SS120-1]|uniref:Polyketide synthase n=1 Tax=Cyanophage SS120-1 TaxID=616674 RepID=M1T365_9CAUD|nr:internal virion protein [Cyanophage SS120-1]AGG54535.1 polyketide synthase [Cyanophage SS120-1]
MKPYYRKATVKDAILVANNLRKEDREEVEGLGHSPIALPFLVHLSSTAVAFFDEDGTIGGVGGIMPDKRPHVGQVWMLCTPIVTRKPHTFVRHLKRWLKEQHDYRLLWNIADTRNIFHHKLLKLLGFKALKVTNQAPYFRPYLEIVKLCVSQP